MSIDARRLTSGKLQSIDMIPHAKPWVSMAEIDQYRWGQEGITFLRRLPNSASPSPTPKSAQC